MPRPRLPLRLPLALAAPLLLHAPAARAAPAPVANAPYLPGFDAAVGGNATPAPTALPPPPAAPAPAAAMPGALGVAPPMPAAPTTAADYMAVAAQAVTQLQAAPALRALGRAETRLISRSVPLFQTHRVSRAPAVLLIEQARQAVRAGDFAAAATLIARATPLVREDQNAPLPNPPVGLPTAPR